MEAALARRHQCLLGLARPAWDVEEQQLRESGRDVIFLLDVSRSMLAEDMHPNRLENAKTAIRDCLETLSGDRVALEQSLTNTGTVPFTFNGVNFGRNTR